MKTIYFVPALLLLPFTYQYSNSEIYSDTFCGSVFSRKSNIKPGK